MGVTHRFAVVVVVAACGTGGGKQTPVGDVDDVGDVAARDRAERWYRLSWRGSPVGWAVERETDGMVERIEHVEVLRGTTLAITDLTIQIDITADLAPSELRVTKRESGDESVVRAVRDETGWRRVGGSRGTAGKVFAPADAVPSELVPAMVRASGAFAGPVILAGWDLAVGDGVVIPAGEKRLAARTVIGDRAIDAAIELNMHGNTERVVDSTGTVEYRMDKAGATAAFEPVDVIAAGSIALTDTSVPIEITLDPRGTPLPPALPGQRVVADGAMWKVTLDPSEPGALPAGSAAAQPVDAEIHDITAGVSETISPSLGGNTASAGDCTAYAVTFAAYAGMAGIPTKVVTGFLVDGSKLVRHRWNVAWTGTRWMTVDASQPDVPAPRLGIAISDDSIPGLTAAAMFDVGP
jgi:hypothetical protein